MIVMIVVACYTAVLDMNASFCGFLPLSIVKLVCGGAVGGGAIGIGDCVSCSGVFSCVDGGVEYNIHHQPPKPLHREHKMV